MNNAVLTNGELAEQEELLERGSARDLLRFVQRHKGCDLEKFGVAIAERGSLFQLDAFLASRKEIPENARAAVETGRLLRLQARARACDGANDYLASFEGYGASLTGDGALKAFSEIREHLHNIEEAIVSSPNPMVTAHLAQKIAAAQAVFGLHEKPGSMPVGRLMAFPADMRSVEQGDDALLRTAEHLCRALGVLHDRVCTQGDRSQRETMDQMSQAIVLRACEERLVADAWETGNYHRETREALETFSDVRWSHAVAERLDEYAIADRESGAYAERETEAAVREAESLSME